MKRIIYLFFFILPLGLNAQSEFLPSEIIESIEKRIAYGQTPSIAIDIVDENGMLYYSFGETKLEKGEAVNEHTIYEIGSITKTFTALLLALAVGEGEVNLDDPVQKFMPDGVTIATYDDKVITLAHLSDHTSALPRMPTNFEPSDPSNPYKDYTREDLYEFLNDVELSRNVGSEYEYSNLAVGLLGLILADLQGVTYDELVAKKITGALKMKETAIALDKKMRKNLAYGYNNGMEVSNWDITSLVGAGGIRSSVYDMLKYLEAQAGIKSSKLSSAMKMTQDLRHDKAGGIYVGLDWHAMIKDSITYYTHSGGTGGYSTTVVFSPQVCKGVEVLTNSTSGADDIAQKLLNPDFELVEVKKQLSVEIAQQIDHQGIEKAWERFYEIQANQSGEYDNDENSMNSLGYGYLGADKIDEALTVFEMNIKLHPKAFNPYDSYGEALMKDGQNELAIENYKKSLELNPANTNGIEMLEKLGVVYEV